MRKGDIFGMTALLGDDHFVTIAECAQPTTVLAVEVAPFRELLHSNAQAGHSIMNVLARAYFSRYIHVLLRFQHILNDVAEV